MKEVILDIPTIKQLYPELNKCFGFTYEDISNELTHVYAKKAYHLTPEEQEIANQCKSEEDWGIDSIKFALMTNENIVIIVSDDFNPQKVIESYRDELQNDEATSYALFFMAALLSRDKIMEVPLSEGEYDEMQYLQYIYEVRPDMLKLYIALNQPKQKDKDKKDISTIKISFSGNSTSHIGNKEFWANDILEEYLHKYLGVTNIEEAQRELEFVYGNKKVGNKMIDPIQSLYIWGTYHLLQNSSMKSKAPKSVSNDQSRLIKSYLNTIGLIDADDIDTDAENIRGRLNSFLKKYDTVEALLDYKRFKLSPNNIGGTKLW